MTIPISLLVLHFVSDFLFQTDWMALNKSKSNKALTIHAAVYSLLFLAFGLRFAAITFLAHWITDYFTSKWTSKLWFFRELPATVQYEGEEPIHLWEYVDGKRHWFFVAIGFDQLIHFVTLALTWRYFYGS